MACATRGRHQLGMSTAGPRSPKEPRMPVRLRWCFCQTGQAVTDCVSLCQPEFVYVRPRRPVRLRCCLCQTQERGAAGNAELVHTLVLLVVLWCTLLVHSGAHYWCTLEHRALDSTGALRSVGAACAAGGSFPRSVLGRSPTT